jgi:hypothetical protein
MSNLPVARDVTLSDGSEVPSSLINNLQDGIVSLFGSRRKKLGPSSAQFISGPGTLPDGRTATGGAVTFEVDLPVEEGSQINSVKVWLNQTNAGAARATVGIYSVTNNNVYVLLNSVENGNAAVAAAAGTGWTSVTVTPSNSAVAGGAPTPKVCPALSMLKIRVVLQTATDQWAHAEANVARVTL